MNLLLLASKTSTHLNYLTYINKAHTLYTLDDEDELLPAEIDALITRPWTRVQQELLEQYPNLTHIFVTWVGTNHIDKQYCLEHQIQIINRPWSNTRAVADMAVWWIINHARMWTQAVQDIQTWTVSHREIYTWRSLCELSYGFVGCGMITLEIWKSLSWFDVKEWVYYDPYVDGDQDGLKPASLTQVASCDCLIVAAPHTPDTHEMINVSLLVHLPQHAIVINIARGGLVNENECLTYFSSHPDRYYYTDVRQWEPALTDYIQQLSSLPNVIITPHIAYNTHEAQVKSHWFEELI